MKYEKLSSKQLFAMIWWSTKKYKKFDGIICDGSIRSGKTLSMSIGFVMWAMSNFDKSNFAICGKTIESLRRNVVTLFPNWLEGLFIIKEHRSENYIEIRLGKVCNRFYIFGGRDESSASLIQGMTLSGIMLDEVALMPRSFVEQALARCSVSGSKFWFNCNPESPMHWFYLEWVKKHKEKNMLYLHFTMNDNYSLDNLVKSRYESLYSGVFYDRYIKGLWCIAEGLVYTNFDKATHIINTCPDYGEYYVSVDYGTLNPFSAGLWCVVSGVATRVSEFYYDGRKKQHQLTDEEYYQELKNLIGDNRINYIIVDPSAASFIECVKRHGEYSVRKAKNDVLDGIRTVANMLNSNRIKINDKCKDSIREFSLYRWDDRGTVDKVLKENDHAMDDIRYFCYTVLRHEFEWDW